MNIQNYLLCILYIILIVVHSYTICHRDFYRGLTSIFSFALFAETISTILDALHQIVLAYGQNIQDIINIDLSSFANFHYIAQLTHITAINFFILFLLIIAKGWPITRSDMPFKYAFAIFWILCLAADLITFYWTTLTAIARNLSDVQNSSAFNSTTIIENLPKEQEQFNSTPRRLSLLLRIVIMLYFLLELRTTMILEQEKKKLQFYLHFGALTMVWFVQTVIVYIISLRVDSTWQSKLISGFSSAANFLGFAVTTRLLWPKNSRSDLFRKNKTDTSGMAMEEGCELDNFSTFDRDGEDHGREEYDGLQMRDLNTQDGKQSVR